MRKDDHQITKELKAMKAVYSYHFPEVRKCVNTIEHLDSDIFLTTTPVSKAQDILDKIGLQIKVPARNGLVDLDELHEPVIDNVIKAYDAYGVKGIGGFKYRYWTAGLSEGIFHTLARLRTQGETSIAVIREGEYEGYNAYASALGMKTKHIGIDDKVTTSVFVSNPNAEDGNVLYHPDFCRAFSGNSVYMDLAYVGIENPSLFPGNLKYDLTDERIKGVFLSFSKPYGLFRYRIGFTFSREPIDSLYGNKWFKDVGRLLLAEKIVEELPVGSLYPKYAPTQRRIVEHINDQEGLHLEPSDVLLLAKHNDHHLSEGQRQLLEPFRRGTGYRLCLTPYFEEYERNGGTK